MSAAVVSVNTGYQFRGAHFSLGDSTGQTRAGLWGPDKTINDHSLGYWHVEDQILHAIEVAFEAKIKVTPCFELLAEGRDMVYVGTATIAK